MAAFVARRLRALLRAARYQRRPGVACRQLIFKVREIGARGIAAKTAGYTPAKTRARSTLAVWHSRPRQPHFRRLHRRRLHFHLVDVRDRYLPRVRTDSDVVAETSIGARTAAPEWRP